MNISQIRVAPAAAFSDIRREQRVVHTRYGRGCVREVRHFDRQAAVLFDNDGDVPRTVWLRDLSPEPADMPADVLGNRRVLS